MKQFHYHAYYTPSNGDYESGWVSGDMETDDQYDEADVLEMLFENEHCIKCSVWLIDESYNLEAA